MAKTSFHRYKHTGNLYISNSLSRLQSESQRGSSSKPSKIATLHYGSFSMTIN